MKHGAGWIVYEESYERHKRTLLSILPARRSINFVAQFMEQIYTDRFASIEERMSYKKHPTKSPFKAIRDFYNGPMHVGHDPFFVGIYAREITTNGNVLEFSYKIAVNREDPRNPVFENRHQTLVLDA